MVGNDVLLQEQVDRATWTLGRHRITWLGARALTTAAGQLGRTDIVRGTRLCERYCMKRILLIVIGWICVFAFFANTLLSRDTKPLLDYDQAFYHSIAFDLHRHNVYSNGVWMPPGNEGRPPAPGMMYMPLYPLMIWGSMQIDKRFAAAIACVNQLRQDRSPQSSCENYNRPMMILHALFLSIGILAIALAAQWITSSPWLFPLTLLIATLGAFSHANLLSYMMTESLTLCLYSLAMLAFIAVVTTPRPILFALSGATLGLLVLTRPSFLALAVLLPALLMFRHWSNGKAGSLIARILLFLVCFEAVLLPWQTRNYLSVGKFGLSEEYGAFNIIVRFGYNQMPLAVGLIAFTAALPQIGVPMTSALFGNDTPKPGWGWTDDTLYGAGGRKAFELRGTYGRLDPIIYRVVADELRENWWRHLLTTIPIAWTGLWIGQTWGLLLIPIFGVVLLHQLRRRQYLLIYYSAPALAMIIAHAAFANHAVRFNIGFIGPVSIAATLFLFHGVVASIIRKGSYASK